MKRALLAALLAMAANSALAVGGLADITVFDRSEHRALPVFYHDGKYFVAGKPGNEYQVTIRNQSGGDLLAVASVDGVNVISGDTASYDQTGYIVNSGQSLGIRGWRKNMQRIAAFYFTDLGDSYAARTGRPENVGVIGVALFQRKPLPQPEPATQGLLGSREGFAAKSAPAPAPGNGSDYAPEARDSGAKRQAESSLGTGHGKSESSYAQYAQFERMSNSPQEVITIYYDSYRNLAAKGVVPAEPGIPQPFPGHFVADPPA